MKLVRDSLLRRYTPPTCTLELWQARGIWQREPKVLPTDYQFVLHFDDPRLLEDQQMTLTGTPPPVGGLGPNGGRLCANPVEPGFLSQSEATHRDGFAVKSQN